MKPELLFYFDFMSPYAYLAHQRLPGLAQSYGYELVYKPMDLPSAKRAAGNTGPPNVQIPVKLKYLMTDMERWAQRYGVPLRFPASLRSARMNKGLYFAQDRGSAEHYVNTAWNASWGDGGDMGEDGVLSAVAERMGWNADVFLSFIASAEADARFDAANLEAQARGVFGVPTMIVGEQMWWGNDRLDFLQDHLSRLAQSG